MNVTYDAWGLPTLHAGPDICGLNDELRYQLYQLTNQLTYRGYFYDFETGLYYLQSRYYSPTWSRFINADKHFDTQDGILGTNMFIYCHNNPVSYTDPSGEAAGLKNTYISITVYNGDVFTPTAITSVSVKKYKSVPLKVKVMYYEANLVWSSSQWVEKINKEENVTNSVSSIKWCNNDASIAERSSGYGSSVKITGVSVGSTKVDIQAEYLCPLTNKYIYSNVTVTINVTKPDVEITKKQMTDMGWKNRTDDNVYDMNRVLNKYGITSIANVRHFISQCAHESGWGTILIEEYGTDKYRGSGYIQLTSSSNYQNFADYIGDQEIYTNGAEYVASSYPWESVGWFWAINTSLKSSIDTGAISKLSGTESQKYVHEWKANGNHEWKTMTVNKQVNEVTRIINGPQRVHLDRRQKAYDDICKVY